MIGSRLYRIFGYTVMGIAALMILLRILAVFLLPTDGEWLKHVKSYVDYPLNIESTQLTFSGWYPIVDLHGVDILTEDHQLALTVNHIKLVLNPYGFLFKRIELKDLTIEGMKIRIKYDPETSSVSLVDLPKLKWKPDEQAKQTNKIAIKRIHVKESDIHLIIDKNKSLPFAEVDLQVDESFPTRFRGRAVVLNEPASNIQFSADFPIFGKTMVKFYGHWENASLEQIAALSDKTLPSQMIAGSADLHTWVTVDKKGSKEIVSEITLSDDAFVPGRGWIKAKGQDRDWKIMGHWEQKGEEKPFEFSLNTFRYREVQCYGFQTWNIELKKAISKINMFIDEEPSVLAWMREYEGQGMIDSLSFSAIQDEIEIVPVGGSIIFKDFGFKAGEKHPGIQGISGKCHYQDGKIRLSLNSRDVVIDYPKGFFAPVLISHLQTEWAAIPTEDTRVHGIISTLQIADTIFSGNVSIDQEKGEIQNIDLTLEGKEWPLAKALTLLPRKMMDKTLIQWLGAALQDGNIQQSVVRFKGNPKDFPFDKQQGFFEAKLGLENVRLDYDKAWPALNDLKANLIFRNREMLIESENATIAGGALLVTQAKIADLAAPVAILNLNAQLQNQLPQAMEVIKKSPLNSSIGKSLSALQFNGGFDLDLGLTIPLTKKTGYPVKVKGKMKLEDAQVLVPDWKLEAEHLRGVVLFSEKTVSSDGLIGKMLDHETVFTISTALQQDHSDFQIKIKGHVGPTELEKWLALSDYHFRADFLSGDTDYVATVDVSANNKPLVLKIQTDLDGVEIRAPIPFGKDAKVLRASLFSLEWQPHEEAQLALEYGEQTRMAMLLKAEGEGWRFQGGHINLGTQAKAKARDDGILLIDGQIDELNVNEWKKLLLEGPSNTLSFEPLIALNIHKLAFANEAFSKTHVEAQWDKVGMLWNFHFDGPSLKGHVVLPEGDDQREMVIDLKKLTMVTSNAEEGSSFQLADQKVIQRPIEVKIKKLKVNGKALTDFQARVEPSWKGYDIPRLQAKLKNTEILLSGQWDVLSHTKQVSAEGKILTRNTSDLFSAIGIAGTVHHAKGSADFSIQWQGTPMSIDYPTLTGKASFHLTNGYVQGVDPGIGRVLNLLSLDTVQRRLNLDFSDVTKKGFAFDEFEGAFQFGKGKVSSNKVSLQGPSANIESYGQADLGNQEISGVIIVMPNVTGSLPVAAAIAAGNPAVGAAVWLVDKIVSKKLQEIHRYRYRLVGTWDSPKLEVISSFPMSRG